MASRRVINDSDDDEDGFSPIHSPPLIPVPERPPEHTSSTDPSFFRGIYEEQQRELGEIDAIQAAPALREHPGNLENVTLDSHNGTGSTPNPVRDLWEVPSSPEAPPISRPQTKRRRDYASLGHLDSSWDRKQPPTKRLRGSSVDGDSEDIGLVAIPPTDSLSVPGTSNALEISIPLKSMSTSEMDQYQTLSSLSVAHDEAAAEGTAPAQYVTQSTIAYTTPSMYASSGRRGAESSGVARGAAAGIHTQSPIRSNRASSPAAHLLSSPDVLAVSSSSQLRREKEHSDRVQVVGDSGERAGAHGSQKRQSQREEPGDRPYQEDIPADLEELPASDEDWESSFGSPSRRQAAKKGGKKAGAKKSRGRDSEEDAVILVPSDEESGSAYNSEPVKPKPKAKRGRKKKEESKKDVTPATATADLLEPAAKIKRPRGRPKKADTVKAQSTKEEIADSMESKGETDPAVEDDEAPRVLGETSGNSEIFKAIIEEDMKGASGSDCKSAMQASNAKEQKEQAPPPLATGKETMVKSIVDINNSQGRVPFRVGLSKKSRIAPLLKSLKK